MRKKTFSLTESTLMMAIGGQLFDQAPNREPRKAEIIMKKVRDKFREKACNDNEFYTLNIPEDELYDYIKNILMSIDEFRELNLTYIEYQNNVSVDDPNRTKYNFVTAFDKEDSESWKNDFIDLDAFVRNANRNIHMVNDSDRDCFFCIHKDTDKCGTCILNSKLKLNYECSREPKGFYTFACKYDCFNNYYICCEECKEKTTCKHKCGSCSSDCGLAINHKK